MLVDRYIVVWAETRLPVKLQAKEFDDGDEAEQFIEGLCDSEASLGAALNGGNYGAPTG